MTGMKLNAAVYNHIGRRLNNEDNFYINGSYMEREMMDKGGLFQKSFTDPVQIYAVCDGMGGAEIGEDVSYYTVTRLKQYQSECAQPDSSIYLEDFIAKTSDEIDQRAMARKMKSGSTGSTLAMLIFNEGYARAVHVGDSRAYLLRGGCLERLTRDHSEVQRMIDLGELSEAEARHHERLNQITRHLGMPAGEVVVTPEVGRRDEIHRGDRYLLCSDGLSDPVDDASIGRILAGASDATEAVHHLVKEALGQGGSDNVTALCVFVEEAGAPSGMERIRRARAQRKVILGGILCVAAGIAYIIADIALNALR